MMKCQIIVPFFLIEDETNNQSSDQHKIASAFVLRNFSQKQGIAMFSELYALFISVWYNKKDIWSLSWFLAQRFKNPWNFLSKRSAFVLLLR